MSTIQVVREPRRPAPPIEKGELALQEPPALPEVMPGQWTNMLMYLPMMVGSGAMMLFYVQPGQNRGILYLSSGLMAASMGAMAVGYLVRAGSERKSRLKGERRDYLRYLGQIRKQVRGAVDKQRTSVLFTHPDPARLWALVPTDRLWERRAGHADFAEVRIGLGQQKLALVPKAPQTKPVEDLEPLCASALRRFLRAYTVVEDMPVAVYLRGFARISLDGDTQTTRAITRAIVAQLAAFHSPEDLWIAVLATSEKSRYWEWVKWLPHAQHPEESDAAGPVRMIFDNWADLERMLGGKALEDRGRFEPAATPTEAEPFVVVVLDQAGLPGNHRLAGPGYRNVVVIDIAGTLPWDGATSTLRLRLTRKTMEKVGLSRAGDEERVAIGHPDYLSVVRTRALARVIAPYRVSATVQSTDATSVSADLAGMLGVDDLRTMDPRTLWQQRTAWDHLRIPIGVSERGTPVELDLKESAQGGMGPHGILIGATGSGKSELIRTIVLSLAMTHSSEKLNMVLVDFKGGATFLGLDGLPHVSALITNLVDELPLVDRMQDALQGELVRRQELLRKHGYSSVLEWERARAGGADLAPLPTLVVIVDEFGELLSTKSEFGELFMMMGRLGRSLAVHLLLASQRFEEGRIHTLETHLSYRLGLKMYSMMESRSVIGTGDAYEQPLPPGTGFLRTDTTTLIKFRGAYVSGPGPVPWRRRRARPVSESRIVPFEAGYVVPLRRPEPEPEPENPPEAPAEETVLQVIVDRLRNSGPPAHRVWLPPLDLPATLDQLLPPLGVDPRRGFGAAFGGLRVPVALVDRPYEQRRDIMVAELDGAKGHVAVLGAPRMGKSTMVRTLITALALTHTPAEVQFYILDFGGGGLSALAGLPHVGGVAGRRDKEKVIRTVAEATTVVDQREALFGEHGIESMPAYRRMRAAGQFADDRFGDVFLVIDGWFTLRQEFETLETRIQEIATRGLTYGVHLVVSSARWSEIRPWLRDALQTRLELRLGDPMESEIDFRKAKDIPETPGRGMTVDKYHFLAAVPRVDGVASADDAGDATAQIVAAVREHWSGPPAPPVRMLPARLPLRELPPVPSEGAFQVPYGLDGQRLHPVSHDFSVNPYLLIYGDHESGKTNLLRLFARAIVGRYSAAQAQVLLVDPRRRLRELVPAPQLIAHCVSGQALREALSRGIPVLKERIPAADLDPQRLAAGDWWSGPRLFVLIDDYDMVATSIDSPAESLTGLLPHGVEIGLHVVLARSTTNGLRGMNDPLIRRIWDLGTPGLLMSCPKDEVSFLGDAKPLTLPPGRAQLVVRRQLAGLVQTALVDEGV
jgi:S-DNA-T family DNA segregation ATPase FtsK/SpoIIIE